MNKTNIEWTDFTWNPMTGCLNGCPYCYARKMAQRLKGRFGYDKEDPFAPTFHPSRMLEPGEMKKPQRIFTVSMGDMFSDGVLNKYIQDVYRVMFEADQHIYQVLTKRPDNIVPFLEGPEFAEFPQNLWVGVSVAEQKDLHRINRLLMNVASVPKRPHLWVSFEPLHSDIRADLRGIEWVVIGAETGNRKERIEPEEEWVQHIVYIAEQNGIPVFMKDNLKQYYSGPWKRELPEEMQKFR